MYEPPAAAAAASLAQSAAGVPTALLTFSEKTRWERTGLYKDAVATARLYEKHSPFVKVIAFGHSAEGRTLYAVIVSKDKAFTPQAAHRTGKSIVLIQNGIHSGEIEGKDTSLMLVRDMAIMHRPEQAKWLNKLIFVIIPVFEVDGHEDRSAFNRPEQNGPELTGTRPQEQQLNLNRDYLKAETPEMKAFLRLYNDWLPDFMIDNHVTDGADYQYDVTWDMTQHEDIGSVSREWVNHRYVPELNKRMEADGHLVSPYGELRQDPTTGSYDFDVEVFSPRYSHYWSGAHNRPCLLVESHSLKSPKTRAWSHYDIMRHSLDIVAESSQELHDAVRASDRDDAAMAGKRGERMFLGGKTSENSHPQIYRSLERVMESSPITGALVPRFTAKKMDITVAMHDGVTTTASAPVPLGFLIPAAWKNIADMLALQGVHMERTHHSIQMPLETWRFNNVKKAGLPFEGHTFTAFTLMPVKEPMHMPAGSYYVPMNQPRARIIMAMLHPEAPDSLAHWGYFDAIFSRTGEIDAGLYLAVPIANKVAAEHPAWWREFQIKLDTDATFANDPKARLQWWISRSNYQPSPANLYPVAEVWEKTW